MRPRGGVLSTAGRCEHTFRLFCTGGVWASVAQSLILNRAVLCFPHEVEAYRHQLSQNKILLQVCPMAHI